MTLRWNRALVTGASSGIGREIARQLAADGTDLVVVARDEQRLLALKSELDAVDVEVLVADLGQADQLDQVEERLAAPGRPIDLLVNNAGFGMGGPFVDNDMAIETDVVAVNVVALMRLAHSAAVAMSERGRGGILNVSSLAGELVAPNSAVYSATKAFVTSFSESIAEELHPAGVTVSCLLPGMTRTEFQQRAEFDTSGIPEMLWQDAPDVASEALEGLAAGRARIVPSRINKVAGGAAHTMPKVALRRIGRAALKLQK